MLDSRLITRRSTLGLLTLAAGAGVAGCNVLGLAAYKLSKAPKHPPLYKLAQEPTLVLVEKSSNPAEATINAQRIAQVVTDMMTTSKAAPMIASTESMEVRSRRGPDGRRLRPAEVGLACKATQVIYVDLTHYQSSTAIASEVVEGNAEATVWVIDAKTGQVKWPADAALGFAVSQSVPFTPVTGGTTEVSLRRQMDDSLGQKIGRLFSEWQEE